MKKRLKCFIAVFCCLALFSCLLIPAQASDTTSDSTNITEIDLGNGFTATDVLTSNSNVRATTRYASRLRTFYFQNEVIARIEITAQFRYDGTTVSVIAKGITQDDTYDGWKFNKTSFTASGGTLTLKGTLTKSIFGKAPVDMSISCDKNGNVS